MNRSKFDGLQIAFLLLQAEEGANVEEVCHKAPISVPVTSMRILTIVDAFSRLSLAIYVRCRRQCYRRSDVVETLERVSRLHGKPRTIRVDNGPEFISKTLDMWA